MISLAQHLTDVSFQSTDNNRQRLSDYYGQYLILYFYPKDNTPGCTQQAQDFRDNYDTFVMHNCVIVGVSRDSLRSHTNFRSKHTLPFHLIADSEEILCQLFNVIALKSMYGKQVLGIERSTFLISPEGVLLHEWRKVKVKGHCDAILNHLAHIECSLNN